MEDADAAEVPEAAMADAVAVTDFYLGEHVRLMGQSVEMLHLQRLRDLLAWLRGKGPKVILARGDEVWVYYYKDDLAAEVAARPDIFKKVK